MLFESVKILIFEADDVASCNIVDIKNKLIKMKYQVEEIIKTNSTQHILKQIKKNEPDIILFDINALETKDIKIIKNNINIPLLPLLENEESVSEKLRELGYINPYDYVIQPYYPRELHCNIQIAIKNYNKNKLWLLEQSLKSIPLALVLTTNDGYIKKWMAKSENIFGYKEQEVISKKLNQVIKSKFEIKEYIKKEIECKSKNDTDLYLEMISKKVKKPNDENKEYLLWMFDNRTEERQIEHAMDGFYDNVNAELEKMVKERTKELEKANKLLEEYAMTLEQKVAKRTKELKKAHKVMLKELEMARRVQLNILPNETTLPKRKELNFYSKYEPLEAIGGDLFDIIRIGKNGISVLIVDVSGHGVPSALVTTMAKVSFNSHSYWGETPSNICLNVNKDLLSLIGDLPYFLTAYYCNINLETGIMSYTNAGHHPALVFNEKRGEEIISLDTRGSIIGAFDEDIVVFETEKIQLIEGDKLMFLTDGIIETQNYEGSFYGYKRLKQFLTDSMNLPIKEIVDGIMDEVVNFSDGREAEDDKTVLCVEFLSKADMKVYSTNNKRINNK